MQKKSIALIILWVSLIILAVLLTFYRYQIRKDYVVTAQVPCDPSIETCFIGYCDPESEKCSNDPALDTFYYKKISKVSSAIDPVTCDEESGNCRWQTCLPYEPNCVLETCDPETAAANGEGCIDPATYQSQNMEPEGGEEELAVPESSGPDPEAVPEEGENH